MLLRQVALVAENVPSISASDLAAVAAALQKQATRDFGPIWGVDATVDHFPSLDDVPIGYWPIVIRSDSGNPNALGYHLDPHGQPMAMVEATDQWPLTASHECLEMLADPTGFRLVAGPSIMPGQGRVEYLVEVADPCAGPAFAYTVNGVLLSDFVTPDYYAPPDAASIRYDYRGQIAGPRQVLTGGYLTWHDPTMDHWWQLRRFGEEQFVDLGILDRGNQSLRGMIDRVTRPPQPVYGGLDDVRRLQALSAPAAAYAPATGARAAGWRQYLEGLAQPAGPARPGLPSASSIFAQATLAAPSGNTYRILATTERDPKDPLVVALAPDARLAALAARPVPVGDGYQGTARAAAKLSIAPPAPEDFADVTTLVGTLPDHARMRNHVPPITTDATAGRVAEEDRNVRLRAFLYAASREADNDFHLIVGDAPAAPPTYLTAEVSGLPADNATSYAQLKAVREAFKGFFKDQLPAQTYDFYDPPIPVALEGSLFWDASHATGGRPGPSSLRPNMPVVWEVHPITSLTFEP